MKDQYKMSNNAKNANLSIESTRDMSSDITKDSKIDDSLDNDQDLTKSILRYQTLDLYLIDRFKSIMER